MAIGPVISLRGKEKEPLIGEGSPKPTVFQLLCATVCFAGVQFGWALQISQLTPFVQELGIPKTWSSIVWLCGPIAGLLVQPIVGVTSDNSTSRFGRRRPYIFGGGIAICLALLMIPNSVDIASHFTSADSRKTAAISIAVLGFVLLDVSNNMLQGPCRALLADIAHNDQQELGNALFSVWLGIGNVTGYAAGFVPWSQLFPWAKTEACDDACASLRVAFSIAVVLVVVAVSLTCLFTKEVHQLEPPGGGERRNVFVTVFGELFRALSRMPRPMVRICVVQFLSWFGWFCWLIYITDWVGTDVYGGDSQAASSDPNFVAYTDGVRMGTIGLSVFAVVSTLSSPLLPRLVSMIGPKLTWAGGQVMMAVLLIVTLFVKAHWVPVIVIGLFGIPWSVSMVVPFALTSLVAPDESKGLYMGVLNIFVVLPQFIVAFGAPFVLQATHDRVSAVLAIGGGVSVFAALACYFLIVPRGEKSAERVTEAVPDVNPKGTG